ncbi:hypothetical protein [Micromonospora sp. bgisy143]|uniref:hypothetical protein n=1 Tax=Micromonospora sp. bgisy143 TaxID=3413790 RepID=UPI003EB95173
MARKFGMTLAGLLMGIGATGVAVLLAKVGLDRAEKWVSIAGAFGSTLIGAAGLAMGWLTLRRPRQLQVGQNPERLSPSSTDCDSQAAAAPPLRNAANVEVHGSKGVQIGDTNIQWNKFD